MNLSDLNYQRNNENWTPLRLNHLHLPTTPKPSTLSETHSKVFPNLPLNSIEKQKELDKVKSDYEERDAMLMQQLDEQIKQMLAEDQKKDILIKDLQVVMETVVVMVVGTDHSETSASGGVEGRGT